jgi:hypothetical protein
MRRTVNLGRRVWRAALVAVAFGALFATSAGAKSVRVGQLFTPTAPCQTQSAGATVLQTGVASGRSYTVPKAGVITSWSFEDGAATVSALKLKVGRNAGASLYKIVGEALAGAQTANAVNTYHAHIAVKPGDMIGIYLNGTGNCATMTGNSADTWAASTSDVLPGTTAMFGMSTGLKFPVSVKVALDCVVPHLKGKTLKAAKRALKAHSCRLGKVRGKGRRVKRQRPRAGNTLKPGAKVNVRLG